MKKISTLLFISLLSLSPVCFAVDESAEMSTVKGQEQIVLANTGSIPVGFSRNLVVNAVDHTDEVETSVPVIGIIFASILLCAGMLVRRKKKVKTNDIVGAFARIS